MPAPGDQYRDTPATVNPFAATTPRISEYTAREIATLQSRLDKQLGPEYLSTRPGAGGKVHYLAADKVINLANEVFGFNGWSSSIQNVTIDFVDEHPENGKITLGLSTIVRVTVRDGTFHEDVGYGHIENCKGKAAAFEKAKKAAATDGMKRALRNFGNVLGNCLYDEEYITKVAKLKVPPSKWDAQNLHRHREYAPTKTEPGNGQARAVPQRSWQDRAMVDAKGQVHDVNGQSHDLKGQTNEINGHMIGEGVRRNPSMQSVNSVGSGEFEDDFGQNLFDDTDFGHPDEVRLDDSTTSIDSPAQRQMNAQGNGLSRMQSAPHLRPPNVQYPESPGGMQAPQRPHGVQAPQAPPPRMLPAQPSGNQQRPVNGGPAQHLQLNADAAGLRSHPSSMEDQQSRGTHRNNSINDYPTETYQPPLPQGPPPDVLGGFVTGRSAALINQAPDARPAALIAFNPHAESPSLRRTHGVNPGKSAPILRQNLPAAAPTNTIGAPGLVPPSAAAPLQQPGMPRANFVNPAADPNRRIGMPPAGGLRNGTAYKPPTPLKRPPMADVTNLPQVDGGPEAKKQKFNDVETAEGGTAVAS